MGACMSSGGEQGSLESNQQSRFIDNKLREDEKRMAKEVKLLLLGAGDTGKSTILKSMRIIHQIPFTPSEKEHYRRLVFSNIVGGMRSLIEVMEEGGEEFEHPQYANYLRLLVSTPDIGQDDDFPASYHEPLRLLWNDSGVQKALQRSHEAAIPENIPYYFSDLDRFFQPNYQPTELDILQCRNKTTGIVETAFPIKDQTYRIFDVGGQRSERRKWIHCFENVTAVLFVVALSGYDCSLAEDRHSNQMEESLMLFENICNSKWFTKTSMILFLNKIDLFKNKIEASPISTYFPDYKEDNNDYDAARSYFKNRFINLNRQTRREIYPVFTNATDTGLLKKVMASVTDIIISNSLRENLL